ncbi:MAG: hypothetical protein NC245_02945 [Muribaculum sp.]|nr:hypothetical protein [Muribaculum sp.]
MADQMEVLLKTERKPEVAALFQFLDEMTPAEQQQFLVFMQGVRFAKGLERKNTATAAQPV